MGKAVMARRLVLPLAGLFCLLPGIAEAHLIRNGAAGFASGFAHPLTGPDHFLAMFAVGLWGARMGGRAVWSLPVTFPLVMVVGGFLGMSGLALPGIEIGIALSIVGLGLAVVLDWRPTEWIALLFVSVFAICHGYAHGRELPIAADPADFAIGFVIATGLIHILGISTGLALDKPFGGRLARTLGGVIALAGLWFLVLAGGLSFAVA